MEDARALKQIGAQLNTPIEERTFTTKCIKTGRNNRQMAGAKTKAQSLS
jgi:hypothetical protein